MHTYAEVDGVHHLISEGSSLEFFLSEGTPKLVTITIGNIVPQGPAGLSADGGHLQIDLDWDSDTDSDSDSLRPSVRSPWRSDPRSHPVVSPGSPGSWITLISTTL